DNQSYGLLQDDLRNLSSQVQTITYRFKALIKDPRGDGSLVECNEGVETIIVITLNPTPRLRVDLSETIYCDSSTVTIDVIDELLSSTGTNAYHLTRTYDDSKVIIETQTPGTLTDQSYGPFDDEVRNLTDEEQTITYTFKPVIIDPRGDASIAECNEGGATTIVITVNPTPRLTATIPETVYCDSTQVEFTVTDGLISSTGPRLYSVYRDYDGDMVHIENETPGLDDNQSYGLLQDDLRNLSSQVQTITYRFKALIKDPRGDGSLVECNEGV
ncbi:MAG: hypothetical protein GY797_29230, partial [Deltaproteobacteria bacterium]|nr:hypothetical protein [Deltaproteobacteria bacterium]